MFYEAKITSQDSGLVYIAAIGYSLVNLGGDAYTWKVFGRRSRDGGDTWENIQVLKEVGLFAVQPCIVSSGNNNILMTYSSNHGRNELIDMAHSLRGLYSNNQGSSFTDYMITDREKNSSPIGAIAAGDQNKFYVVWSSERSGGGNYY